MNKRNVNIIVPKLNFEIRESINMLRGNIQMAGRDVQAVAFTSSHEDEGKSYISFLLADSLSVLEKKVVFLDCDIRNSKIKADYGVTEKTVGLSEYLCGYIEEDELIYHTENPYLDVIFSGAKSPNPSELLSGEQFKTLIDSLRKQYDYVILDTPPSNLVVDATLVAQHCDATIIVVECAATDRRDAIYVKNKLESFGIKIMGVVMNKTSVGKGRYGKYGKYGYGRYGYGKYGYGDEDQVK